MSDPIDELLHHAGARWRDRQPYPPEPDFGRMTRVRHVDDARRLRPRLVMATSAAAVLLVLLIGYALFPRSPGQSPAGQPPAAGQPVPATTGGTVPDPTKLVLRDGDRAAASGTVLAVPGQPVRFCPPLPSPAIGLPSGASPVPGCAMGVTVTGVDLSRLTAVREYNGTRWGEAMLRGVWHGGSLAVTEQGAPQPDPDDVPTYDPPPCPAPEGGWRDGPADNSKIIPYVTEQHPDQFRMPWAAYPAGGPSSATTGTQAVEVLVIEVVSGDLDAARRELRSRYDGNLCVVSAAGKLSIADQQRILSTARPALDQLMADRSSGIWSLSGGDLIKLEMVVLTPQLWQRVGAISPGHMDPRPWLRPVG